MSYTNRPANDLINLPPVIDRIIHYHDRVRWGPIISGVVVALATQLVLTALAIANGWSLIASTGAPRSNLPSVASDVGIGAIVSLFISLFIGAWVTTRACGPMSRSTALLNGAIFWATVLVLSSWLFASGVVGAFGIAVTSASAVANQIQQGTVNLPNQIPNVSAEQARTIAANTANVLWSFVLGSLLGLIASLVGAVIGVHKPSHNYA